MNATDVLTEARNTVQTVGWTKRDDYRVDGGESKFCARGAIMFASGARIQPCCAEEVAAGWTEPHGSYLDLTDMDYSVYHRAMDYADAAATEFSMESDDTAPVCSVVGYNDFRAESVEDVVRLFDRAIELAAEQDSKQLVSA